MQRQQRHSVDFGSSVTVVTLDRPPNTRLFSNVPDDYFFKKPVSACRTIDRKPLVRDGSGLACLMRARWDTQTLCSSNLSLCKVK